MLMTSFVVENDVPDAPRTTLECLQIFSNAGMLLCKWRTNSKQLDLLWQQEGVETEFSETSATDLRPPIKVLGLAWDSEKDLFRSKGFIEIYVT
ncbi:DUF1758 domain-containing protein [Trichonephila clavata]|uniref:DUF1758 domain-containing protein n=1 Tax=Trichonephila clavata TaxID=2740835 RepID=A0A8X6LDX8_TRICU|nr:DUF1758 domain-containing protein [Trichonephila clavata]